MKNEILISNNFIAINQKTQLIEQKNLPMVTTILNNMFYYGYIPSLETYEKLNYLSIQDLIAFWNENEPAFKEITGANREMDQFVVYKNFPQEVLNMSQTEYWNKQILMYWGISPNLFTQEEKERSVLTEHTQLKVLNLAQDNTLDIIYEGYVKNHSKWSDNQSKYAQYLVEQGITKEINLDDFSFKVNGISIIAQVLKNKIEAKKQDSIGKPIALSSVQEIEINLSNATDVLRLAAGMSDGDVSLRSNVKFRKFTRAERRFLLENLDKSNNLEEDSGARKGQFKKLLAQLHPGDYKFSNVIAVYDKLYNDKIETFNAVVHNEIEQKNLEVLNKLKSRPGEFVRRFHKLYELFGNNTLEVLKDVAPELKTIQLLKLEKYVSTINSRENLMFAPKGNWTKVQVKKNEKFNIEQKDVDAILSIIGSVLEKRIDNQFPEGISLDPNVAKVKLQTNDQELADYGRGTEFPIGENMSFIRTASYWENKTHGNNWFDNSWNFFDDSWKSLGVCCWNRISAFDNGAIFSGDPVNSSELKGRACQMIDLNLDQLETAGVRYAVWNILSYSGIKFSDATDVLATLQMGEKAQEGNLYEPSRAQMVFPVTGDSLTKYVAYVDVKERKLVFMDANLYGSVQSAEANTETLSEKMPAYVEYMNTLPSVEDLFKHAKEGTTPVLYSDKDISIEKDSMAYVFKQVNAENDFQKIVLANVLDYEEKEPTKKFKM